MSDLMNALDDQRIIQEVATRIAQTDGAQGLLRSRYNRLRHWYAPANGDQWPWGRKAGQIHLTVNMLKPAVDIDSRLQSILPRIVCVPPSQDDDVKRRAEASEKLILESLEQTGWDVWMTDFTKVKSLLGKGVIKVFWNETDDRPDLSVIETPENLRIGWGASDFTKMDWALYEYRLSPFQVEAEFGVRVARQNDGSVNVVKPSGTDHADPLGQTWSSSQMVPDTGRAPSEYEDTQVDVWDYWYKRMGDDKVEVWNCIVVGNKGGRVVVQRRKHDYLPDIPYILVENDHKPADPDGMSTIEFMLDLQEEYNRLLSHWLQIIADNTDPAWQAVGAGVGSVDLVGVVPKSGQIIGLGPDIQIMPIEKGINQVPLEQGLGALWDAFHKESGLPEITFGQMPGSQTSGRAMAVQIEAVNNRADPRRRRLYAGLRELILFWLYMIEKREWALPVTVAEDVEDADPAAQALGTQPKGKTAQMKVSEVVKGMRRWKIVAPEITPRDIIEHTQTQIELMNARGQALETMMDQVGIDNPLEEIEKIMRERSNASLFPGDVQAMVAAAATLLQMQAQQQQMASAGQAQDMANQAQGAGMLQRQNQEAQPGGDEAAGGEAAGLTASVAGSPPPANGAAPGIGTQQTLIRAQPSGQAQVLQQTKIGGK